MTVVYRLRQNKRFIEAVQKATLTTDAFGIEPTHGLFGSDEWWGQITSGDLPIHTLSGHITKVYMGSMGDWREFAMKSDDEKSQWTRKVNAKEQDALYRVGNRVELDYVIQRYRSASYSASFDRGSEAKCVVEIRILDSMSEVNVN
jgi:hypothetical protein